MDSFAGPDFHRNEEVTPSNLAARILPAYSAAGVGTSGAHTNAGRATAPGQEAASIAALDSGEIEFVYADSEFGSRSVSFSQLSTTP